MVVEHDGELLLSVLRGMARLSHNEAKRLVRSGKVYVDGGPCAKWDCPLRAGQEVTVDTDRPRPSRLPRLEEQHLLRVDTSLIVVNKPSGLVSVPPTTSGEATLLDLLGVLLARRPEGPVPVPIHRLDRETCGLMVFGVKGGRLEPLRSQFARHEALREYFAVVEGEMRGGRLEGTIDVTRTRWGGKRQLKRAVTDIVRVEARAGRTLVRCRPLTGRWHQIRIQLATAGHPICGEREHLPAESPARGVVGRLALQSALLLLRHPESDRPMTFELPLDKYLAGLLGAP